MKSTIIFLGDYCDRGPDTKSVINWLINLKKDRNIHNNACKTYFITGNHDFAMAAQLDCLPIGKTYINLDGTINNEYDNDQCDFKIEGGMHYQGRRWGNGQRYNSDKTFTSYDVEFEQNCLVTRQKLINNVPNDHKKFLRELDWVCEINTSFNPGKIIAVHAGLNPEENLLKQLDGLRKRELTCEQLQENKKYSNEKDIGRLIVFSGRENCEDMHPDLQNKAILISGHHGKQKMEGNRIILDRGGGSPNKPLEAIIFPEKIIINSNA